jgi:hypothetical protein
LGVIVPDPSLLMVSLLPVAAVADAAVGKANELALLLLSSLAVADVGMVKPEVAGAAGDESAFAAGAAPKPPKENPLLVWAVVETAAGAAPPKENPPVVAGAPDGDFVAAGAGALKLNPPVDAAPPPADVDDDAGAAPPNENPPAPIAPAVGLVAVAVAVVPPPPAPAPAPPSRGTSQDAHAFNVSLLYELHSVHFHLFLNNLAFKSLNPISDPVVCLGT